MHRHRPPTVRAAVTLFVALILFSLFVAPMPNAHAQPPRGTRPPQATATTVPVRPLPSLEDVRLACAPDTVEGRRGVLCQWAPATNPATRGYQLFRSVDGSARQLIASVGATDRLAFVDTDLVAPTVVLYAVVSVDAAGHVIGVSAPQRVELGGAIPELRMACSADAIGGVRGVLCRWSPGPQDGTRGYLVYRQVGDRPREVIARVGTDGRFAHFDRDVVTGAVHTYAVTAIDGGGGVVAAGGPSVVIWPSGR